MRIDRLSNGERISTGPAILLLLFMFFRWHGLGVTEKPNLLFRLSLFEDGGNAWQTLVATALATFAVACLGLQSSALGKEFSCRDRSLVDYAQALDDMPPDRLPGPRGLSFGPEDLELRPGQSIVEHGKPFGYSLLLNRPVSERGDVTQPANLKWDIGLELDSVNRFGRPTGRSLQQRWFIQRLRYPERRFELRASAGLYRATIRVQKLDGPTLGEFRQFVRILPQREKFNVAILGGNAFKPGEKIVARIENLGTAEAVLPRGPGMFVEHIKDGEWAKIEIDEPASVMFEDPEFLAGGRASRCSFFTVPPDAVPGRYRFTGLVRSESRGTQMIHKPFAVLKSP